MCCSFQVNYLTKVHVKSKKDPKFVALSYFEFFYSSKFVISVYKCRHYTYNLPDINSSAHFLKNEI